MKEVNKENQGTMDDSPPVFGSWNNWYVGIIVFNILFILLINYLFSNI